MRLYSATQTAALGLYSPRAWTKTEDRVVYGCVILPFGGGDFIVVHAVAYSKIHSCNVLVLHGLYLLSRIRLAGDSVQFQNGHTYGLLPIEQAYFGGTRYTQEEWTRMKVLNIRLGTAMRRGVEVEPWSSGPPVDLASLPIDVTLLPLHLQTSVTQSGFPWGEFQQWLHRHAKDKSVGSCVLAQWIEQPSDLSGFPLSTEESLDYFMHTVVPDNQPRLFSLSPSPLQPSASVIQTRQLLGSSPESVAQRDRMSDTVKSLRDTSAPMGKVEVKVSSGAILWAISDPGCTSDGLPQ